MTLGEEPSWFWVVFAGCVPVRLPPLLLVPWERARPLATRCTTLPCASWLPGCVANAVSAATQSVADEANDVNAEAHRQARIDAAVEERLAALEKDNRAQVTAEVDGCAADSAE